MFLQSLRRSKRNGREHCSSPGPLCPSCLLFRTGILFWNLRHEVCTNQELRLFAGRDLATLLTHVRLYLSWIKAQRQGSLCLVWNSTVSSGNQAHSIFLLPTLSWWILWLRTPHGLRWLLELWSLNLSSDQERGGRTSWRTHIITSTLSCWPPVGDMSCQVMSFFS